MWSTLQLRDKFFLSSEHPYQKYEQMITSVLRSSDTILDAGCGRSAPILRKFKNSARKLVGVDLEDPSEAIAGIHYIQGDISSIDLPSNSVDIVISRAVLEHVSDPEAVFNEIHRILKPGGHFISLLPNLWDYVSIFSKLIPNRFHGYIVEKTEGRKTEDVFPTYYKTNTYNAIKRFSEKSGFTIETFQYLGQYPSMFMFNPYLFLLATVYEKLISSFESLGFLRGWILIRLRK